MSCSRISNESGSLSMTISSVGKVLQLVMAARLEINQFHNLSSVVVLLINELGRALPSFHIMFKVMTIKIAMVKLIGKWQHTIPFHKSCIHVQVSYFSSLELALSIDERPFGVPYSFNISHPAGRIQTRLLVSSVT
jgi:hypothetical protein